MNDAGPRVLIVDDEPGFRRFLHASLAAHGYSVREAPTGEDALQIVPAFRPDIILLDLGLPGLQGTQVTASLRDWTQTPIIILSVQGEESAKIAALDAGADDYLTKPFGTGELRARMRAALRRAHRPDAEPVFVIGDLTVDLTERIVRLGESDVPLTPTEYSLLKAFVVHANRLLTHSQLVREVWGGAHYEDSHHLLRVNISNLRRKLEADPARPRYIVTEPGVGYRLRAGAAS
ncbi:MAG TPA: response regulator transcription factor [Bryobacteraceae bacterium]|nr:response regulator transcription factor [Bryobacteraceae bacterium]